jgi:soluble lytic murein transglycosylase-like protein
MMRDVASAGHASKGEEPVIRQQLSKSAHRLMALAALTTLVLAAPARAQVFEVGRGGVMTVKSDAPGPAPDLGADRPSPITPARYVRAVNEAARRFDLSPALVDSVARQESGYRSAAVSPKGAVGIMQLMPSTARKLGVDAHDPGANILGGAAYLRSLLDRFDGRIDLALAAYNAGPGAVVKYRGVPPYRETRSYVQANLDRLAQSAATISKR